jgi:hypothetical protein
MVIEATTNDPKTAIFMFCATSPLSFLAARGLIRINVPATKPGQSPIQVPPSSFRLAHGKRFSISDDRDKQGAK